MNYFIIFLPGRMFGVVLDFGADVEAVTLNQFQHQLFILQII